MGFRDELSRGEYRTSGLCQKCQDDFCRSALSKLRLVGTRPPGTPNDLFPGWSPAGFAPEQPRDLCLQIC